MEEYKSYEEKILLNVRKIMRAVDMHSSYLARRHGLTSPQLICLKKLMEEGGTTPGALARAVHLSHATVTGIVNRLEKKKLVERSRSMEDGRSFIINVTDTGREIMKKSPAVLQEQFIMKLSKLQEWEKTMILSSLQRITSILSVESLEVAPVLTTGPIEAQPETITEFLSMNGQEMINE